MKKEIKQNIGLELVLNEMKEQESLGFTVDHDIKYSKGQLLQLAEYCILSNESFLPKDGWSIDYIKQFHLLSRKRQIAIAASLLIAEINRRDKLGIDLINDICRKCEDKDKCYEDGILRVNCQIVSNFNNQNKEDE